MGSDEGMGALSTVLWLSFFFFFNRMERVNIPRLVVESRSVACREGEELEELCSGQPEHSTTVRCALWAVLWQTRAQ